MNMEIFGKVTLQENIKILNQSFEEEKKFNDPSIGYEWVTNKYRKNGEKYGYYEDNVFVKNFLYEAEPINFIDTDVFRQMALHFKKYGCYTKLHPDYDRTAFDILWDREQYRRLYGMTAYCGLNADGTPRKVYCPPKLYGFFNYALMLRVKDAEDDELQESTSLSTGEAVNRFKELFKEFLESSTAEKVIDFPLFFDGQYHIAIAREFARNIGKNFFYGKARRKGQSYWNAWCSFDNADLRPGTTTILAAYDKLYLIKGNGLMSMARTYSDHINKHTDWAKNRNPDTKEHFRFSYKYAGEKEERGFKSEVLAVSSQSNPDVAVGKDCWEIDFEELGKFPNFDETYDVTTSTIEAGDNVTGQMVGWGTGGTKEANWETFEEVIYNPHAYNNLPCNNIWDEGAEGTPCGYFFPHVQSLEGHMDEYGNTNYESAWASYLVKKEKQRKVSTDENQFRMWCGQRANSPSEAFSRDSSNIFPAEKIVAQLLFIQNESKVKNAARYGKLVQKGNMVVLMTNTELKSRGLTAHDPIYEFPLKKTTDVHGCIIEYQPPYTDPQSGLVPEGLYLACQDPYAHDIDKTRLTTRHSLGVTYVWERINNITPGGGGYFVASWIGRPEKQDDYNDQAYLLCKRYNAKLMFENDRGDTKRYFKNKRALHLLAEEPDMLFAKEVSKKTGRGYGMHMTDVRKSKAAIYLRDWLMTLLSKGEDDQNNRTILSYIFDEGLLKELLKWKMKGNFDRVSALLVGMYHIKEQEHKEIKPTKAYKRNSLFNRKLFN
jgi:hypothetical protein